MQPDLPECVASVLRDIDLVSHIVSWLLTPQDRLFASLVCKLWNAAVTSRTKRAAIRSRGLLRCILQRFTDVRELNFGHCCDQLQDADIINVSPFLSRIEHLLLGHPDNPQNKVSDNALIALAVHCPALRHIKMSSFPNITDKSIVALAQRCPLLQSMTLESCVNLGDAAVYAISRCGNLQKLTLKGNFGFTPQGLGVIGRHCAALRSVRFELYNIDVGVALKSISAGCTRISECSLNVSSVDLANMAQCTTLTCFTVETGQSNRLDEDVDAIAAANKNLQELTVVNQYEPLSDTAVVRVILSCPLLVKLHIYAARLTGMVLQCLMGCKSLKSLTLDHFKSPARGLAEVGLCGIDLKCLSLRSGRGIRDVELQTLVEGSRWLELLDLQCCHGLSPIGFSAISQCTNLQSLNLSFTQVDNPSLVAIANGMKCLKQLSLMNCVRVSDMQIIAKFSSLVTLNLDQCPFVNDEGLSSIAIGCPQLAHVSFASTQITDKGLLHLMLCSQLQTLRILYCRNVEGEGLVALSRACAWLRLVILGRRFRGTKILEEMTKHFCMARMEIEFDDMDLMHLAFNRWIEVQ